MKHIFAFALSVLLLFSTGCGNSGKPLSPETPDSAEPVSSPTEEDVLPALSPEEIAEQERQAEAARLAQEVEEILNRLTLEEKVGQLFFATCPAGDVPAYIADYHLGGILLFTKDYQDAGGNWLSEADFTAKISAMQTAAQNDTGIPLFIGSDEEGGSVTRASRNPHLFSHQFPSPQQLQKQGSPHGNVFAEDAWEKNSALLRYGINVNFAPVCDISTNPADFIYPRTLGRDAETTADYVSSVVTAMGECGMGSVLKHFPGYGNNADTHTGIATDTRPYPQFQSEDYLPFLAGMESGAPFVLVSHNIVTCLDETYPASLSPAWHEELRNLGFTGIILTDDLNMGAVKRYAKEGNISVLALQAGNDMIVTPDFIHQIPSVIDAVAQGILREEQIDNACRRVLTGKQQLHLL